MITTNPSYTSPTFSPTSNIFYISDYETRSQNRITIELNKEYFFSHYLKDSLNTISSSAFEERLLRLLEALNLIYIDPSIFRQAILFLVESSSKPFVPFQGFTNIHTSLQEFAQTFNEVDYQANQTINMLQKHFIFTEENLVRNYLLQNVELLPILLEAFKRITDHFGSNPQVELKVVSDPEILYQHRLFGYINTNLPVAEAIEKFEAFDNNWFLNILDQTNDKLNFNLKFL